MARIKRLQVISLIFALFSSPLLILAGEPKTTDSSPAAAQSTESRVQFSGWIEGGITGNFDSPADRQNFGRLFDDRSNEPLLNQVLVTAERMLDPKLSDRFDWGFRGQLLYGSDGRYLHSTGLLDLTTDDTIQPDIPEAWILAHFPITGTAGDVDFKVGKFSTSIGAETSDPRMNPFYSHSYIFNYGAPFNATGALLTLHVRPELDVNAGVTRGANVTFDDNNDSVSFYGGLGGSFNDGRFSYLAMTHLGPENPGNNHDYRYASALTLTSKLTDKLTSITDLNYIYEEAFEAEGYGVAQYFTYEFNEWLSASLRGEVWRDAEGFYVAQFASNNDFLHFTRGDDTVFDVRTVGGGRTTYGAITAGVTIKPPLPHPFKGLMLRPEIRYDRSLNNTRPFNDSSDRDMATVGMDAIFSF